jgi:uncharacterized protein (DUF362 family)
MTRFKVAVGKYKIPVESVRNLIETGGGLSNLKSTDSVFIKPNIVFWSKASSFPKFGVITTSRILEDVVAVLKDMGVSKITIGEGSVVFDPKDRSTQYDAFEKLGYRKLEKRYGVRLLNIFEDSFEKIEVFDNVHLNFSSTFLNSDFIVNLPVLKTHAQTVVSLGIKNIKGTININSRKKCHNYDGVRDLNLMVSRLADSIPPCFTLIDGIFSNERGPGFDGKAHRSDIIIASDDVLSADLVGAKILGYSGSEVPHLVHAAKTRNRPVDMSDITIVGEDIAPLTRFHEYTFPYNEDNSLPLPMKKMGIDGISYPKYDLSLCTYCSLLTGAVLASIAMAWKGIKWDDVEVLTGKVMKPTPGKKSILIGKCLSEAHKNHPNKDDLIYVKSCPPQPQAIVEALRKVGVEVTSDLLMNLDLIPAMALKKYQGKSEFDESLFSIQ